MIRNPYAKKGKSQSSTAGESQPPPSSILPSNFSAAMQHTHNLPTTSYGATTFSQAFEAVEDTPHYQQQCSEITLQQKERAEQRALEQQQQQQALSDREHHAFLQPQLRLCVSTRQRGNGVLQYIRNVPYSFETMVPDYIMGTQRCALFLSCKYHSLHPNYIEQRTAELKQDFTLRVLLVLVDDKDASKTLQYLNVFCTRHRLTLILAWSEEEAARYLETYQAMDGKDASLIQKRKDTNAFGDQVADFLSKASVNKTDTAQLLAQFSTVRAIGQASMDELATVSGMGHVKVKRLWDAFHKPFSSEAASKRRKALLEQVIEGGDGQVSNNPRNNDVTKERTDEVQDADVSNNETASIVDERDEGHLSEVVIATTETSTKAIDQDGGDSHDTGIDSHSVDENVEA